MDPRQVELNRGNPADSTSGSSEDIRRQIERRRADMDALASTLAERLSPHQLADEVATAVKRKLASRGERIRMALYDSVRDNPLPWLLVGGGLGWLIVRARSSQNSSETALQLRSDYDIPGFESYRYGTTGRSGLYSERDGGSEKASELTHKVGDATSHAKDKVVEATSTMKDSVVDATDKAKEKLVEASDKTREKVRSAVETTREKASETMDAVSETMGDVRERVNDARAQVMTKGSQWLDEKPLLLCGIALGVGVLVGMAIPTTPVEDQWMGEQRDRLLDSAKGKGQELLDRGKEVVDKVTQVADAAVGSASREVSHLSDRDFDEGARHVVRSAAETARQEAQRQGLVGGGSSSSDGAPSRSVSSGTMGPTSSMSSSSTGSSASVGAPSFGSSVGLPSAGSVSGSGNLGATGSSNLGGSSTRLSSAGSPGGVGTSPAQGSVGEVSPSELGGERRRTPDRDHDRNPRSS